MIQTEQKYTYLRLASLTLLLLFIFPVVFPTVYAEEPESTTQTTYIYDPSDFVVSVRNLQNSETRYFSPSVNQTTETITTQFFINFLPFVNNLELEIPDYYLGLMVELWNGTHYVNVDGDPRFGLSVPYDWNQSTTPAADWGSLSFTTPSGTYGTLKRVQLAVNGTALPSVTLRVTMYYTSSPYTLLYTASDSTIFNMTPVSSTKLFLPADTINKYLRGWNQKHVTGTTPLQGNNPWGGSDFGNSDALRYGVGYTAVTSGTSVRLQRLGINYGTADQAYIWDSWVKSPADANSCNFALDTSADTYSYEFYLDNAREESDATLTDGASGSGELVLYDDDETFWTAISGCTLSEETTTKVKGSSSLKVVTSDQASFAHSYGTNQDWTAYEFFCFWWYGLNDGDTITLSLPAPDWSNVYTQRFTDNFSGWRRFVIPLRSMTTTGSPSISAIREISFGGINAGKTCYLDRLVLDAGQWVKVEARVPDSLASSGTKYALYSWNQGTGAYRASPFLTDTAYDGTQLQFMDQSLQSQVLASGKGGAYYAEGTRSQSVAPGGDTSAGNITYSANYGAKNRIGFAVKLPPDDGQDSATSGISQVRLKLTVSYADEGKATYEFEDSTNDYYGLDRMLSQWFALSPTSGSGTVQCVGFTDAPMYLSVTANENKTITNVSFVLPVGASAYSFVVPVDSVLADSDSDGTPDMYYGINARASSIQYKVWAEEGFKTTYIGILEIETENITPLFILFVIFILTTIFYLLKIPLFVLLSSVIGLLLNLTSLSMAIAFTPYIQLMLSILELSMLYKSAMNIIR